MNGGGNLPRSAKPVHIECAVTGSRSSISPPAILLTRYLPVFFGLRLLPELGVADLSLPGSGWAQEVGELGSFSSHYAILARIDGVGRVEHVDINAFQAY